MTGRETFEDKVGAALDALYDGADLLTGEARRAESLVLSVVVEAARAYPASGATRDFRQWILSRLVRHYLDYANSAGHAEARAVSEGPVGEEGGIGDSAERAGLVEELTRLDEAAPDRLRDLIRRSMRRLPLRERSALWLVNVMDFGYGETARALGVSPSEVRDLLYRARRDLQVRLALALRERDRGSSPAEAGEGGR